MSTDYQQAVEDFQTARRKAATEEILARFRGKSAELLRYDEVRSRLHAIESSREYLEDIPLDAIIGSVNRYNDFTRRFLPRKQSDEYRWTHIKLVQDEPNGLPPILAYKLGDAYFVLDGHHRVSVARQLGATSIQGYVTPVLSKVPLSPEDQPDDLILKAERVDFLEKTKFDELHLESDLTVSAPGQYQTLFEHIMIHKYFMGIEQHHDILLPDAIRHWYETYYLPIVQIIRERNLLREFPGRTETDLYLWISDHQAALREELGWEISTDQAVKDYNLRHNHRPRRIFQRVKRFLYTLFTPEPLESGPEPGEWRKEHLGVRDDRIFSRILVTVPCRQSKCWSVLNMAIAFALREDAWLGGLHVVRRAEEMKSERVLELSRQFDAHLKEAGVPGRMVVEVGKVARKINQRSRWTDLAVIHLVHPPPIRFLPRINSGLRQLIQQCPTPVLMVPEASLRLEKCLLAYDDSPKAKEALYLSAYLAGRWRMSLTVITVRKTGQTINIDHVIQNARSYLENQNIQAEYLERTLTPGDAILQVAEERKIDLIVMGGYSSRPWKEILVGSTVDQVLRRTRIPVLLCK